MAEKVGVVGLGEMGFPMAWNLRKKGFDVFAFDVNEETAGKAREKGIQTCGSVREVAAHSDHAVLTIVRDIPQTEAVIFGEKGIVSSGKRGLSIVMMSTLDPRTVRELGERSAKAGFPLLDAPVSGAKSGAEAATLTIMTAGPREVYDRCCPYFKAMGRNLFYFGDRLGAGQAAKLSNNLILATSMVGCAEGIRYASRHGLPLEELMSLLKVSTGNSWTVQNWGDVKKFWEEYRPGATLDIVYKDLRSIVKECEETGASLPMTASCLQFLMEAWEKPGKTVAPPK